MTIQNRLTFCTNLRNIFISMKCTRLTPATELTSLQNILPIPLSFLLIAIPPLFRCRSCQLPTWHPLFDTATVTWERSILQQPGPTEPSRMESQPLGSITESPRQGLHALCPHFARTEAALCAEKGTGLSVNGFSCSAQR